MLKAVKRSAMEATGERFAIIASKYNRRYVDGMLRKARATLTMAGAAQVIAFRVPGAFEIPVVAERLATVAKPRFSAIICLGVILQGETTHARTISESVTQALAWIQVKHSIPVIHEVLMFESENQARVRCLSSSRNRGTEAGETAIQMARLMSRITRTFAL